jgi:hypothetical protein
MATRRYLLQQEVSGRSPEISHARSKCLPFLCEERGFYALHQQYLKSSAWNCIEGSSLEDFGNPTYWVYVRSASDAWRQLAVPVLVLAPDPSPVVYAANPVHLDILAPEHPLPNRPRENETLIPASAPLSNNALLVD